MIRIFVVDDAETPEFLEGLDREIKGGFSKEVEHYHLNPTSFLNIGDEEKAVADLLAHVTTKASEFWDVALIDLNLRDVKYPDAEKLKLSLSIAETFRKENRASIVMLYSGTLAKYILKLIEVDVEGKKSISEKELKRIFSAEIASFVSRDVLLKEVFAALEEPPLLLLADQILTRYSNRSVCCEESEFKKMKFSDLAIAVRKQNKLGVRLCKLITKYGIASLVDLNT